MVIDSTDTIVYMDADEALSYEDIMPYGEPSFTGKPKELDDELGLEIVQKTTIFQKYGVKCDPNKNSFYRSLYDQFEKRGTLSEKQVNALRK